MAVRGGLSPLSGLKFVKLLIQLVGEILNLSGKSQGNVMDISEISGCGNHTSVVLVFHFEVVTITFFLIAISFFFVFFSVVFFLFFLLSGTEVFYKGMMWPRL